MTSGVYTLQVTSQLRTTLEQVGLSEKESAVYVCLCSFGSQAGSVVARNVGLKRTTVYHSLRSLSEKGLVHHYKKNATTYFRVGPVEEAIARINKEEEVLKEKVSLLKEVSEFVEENRGDVSLSLASVKSVEFEGFAQIRWLKMSTLDNTSEICIFSHSYSRGMNIESDDFLSEFYSRLKERNIKVRMIVPMSKGDPVEENLCDGIDIEVRIISSSLFTVPEGIEMNILDDKVVIIEGHRGMVLDGNKMVAMQKAAFELAWCGAGKLQGDDSGSFEVSGKFL